MVQGTAHDGIISNLTGMFDTLNTKVGEIAGEVGMTPAAWNSSIFNMIRNLSETVIVPIAGIILTFVMWKNDRFFEQRGKVFTSKIAAALLKDGKTNVKGLRSLRTGKTYDGTIVLADTGGKYVNYRIEK